MLSKDELLLQIRQAAAAQAITKQELVGAYNQGRPSKMPAYFTFINILYAIGAAIVILGIVVLVTFNWALMPTMLKIVSTLGAGMAMYFTGLFFGRNETTTILSIVFHLLGAIVIPLGLAVTLDSAGFALNSGTVAIISIILLAFYLASYNLFKGTLFLFFSIIAGTVLFFALPEYLFEGRGIFNYRYLALITGYIYLFLAQASEGYGNKTLKNLLVIGAFTISTGPFILWLLSFPFGFIFGFRHYFSGGHTNTTLVSALLTGFYLMAYMRYKKTILLALTIFAATVFYYAFPSYLFAIDNTKFFAYLTIIAGISYIILGYAFEEHRNKKISSLLYPLGIMGLLSGAYVLGLDLVSSYFALSQFELFAWKLVYPLLLAGIFYLSTVLKRLCFIILGSFFLVIYILNMTRKYFIGNFGWPLSLVIAGLFIIAIAFMATQFAKKYIKES